MIIGVLGGLLGALFIKVNHLVGNYRKKYFNESWKRVHEVVGLVLLTGSIVYFAPMLLYNDCLNVEEGNIEARLIKYLCEPGTYNPLATFLFNPEGTVIKALLNKEA